MINYGNMWKLHFEFGDTKDVKKIDIIRREVAVGTVAAHLCLTLIVKELKTSVELARVVPRLNIIKTLHMLFSVVFPSPTIYML